MPEVVEHEPRPAIHIEKQLGWVRKLGGAESGDLEGGSNSVSQIDEVSDMLPACQLCGGGSRKGIMAFTRLGARHFRLSLNTAGAFQAATWVLELRGSESE